MIMLPAFLFGVCMCFLVNMKASPWVLIIAHLTFNLFSLFLDPRWIL
jgi:hypothetical protein